MQFQDKQSGTFLKRCVALGFVILTIWFIVAFLCALAIQFRCPCRNDQNAVVTVALFIGPAFFLFVIMFHILRPLKYGWFQCPERVEDDTPRSFPKAFTYCLIPPVMWIFFLLLRGEYVACAMTDWNGVSVLDDELNMRWCKPSNGTQKDMELRDLTRKYIHQSQYSSFVLISVFSVLSLVAVGLYDSCISGKYDWCPSRLLLFCGRKVRHVGGHRQDDVEYSSPTSSITTHPLIAFSKNE